MLNRSVLPHVALPGFRWRQWSSGHRLWAGEQFLKRVTAPLPTFWRPFAAATMWPSPERDKERRCSL